MKLNHRYWYELLGVGGLSESEHIEFRKRKYFVENGLLRQCDLYSNNQNQTRETFGYKWKKRETYESDSVQENGRNWLIERYLGGSAGNLTDIVPDGSRVLDAGCGSGYSGLLFFGNHINKIRYLGVDISNAVDVAAERFSERGFSGEFIQADLANLPFETPVFDVIFSEGVLHHTDDTEKTLGELCNLLVPGGRLLFYVYKKKGPIREYTDDFIREHLAGMTDEEAWKSLLPLTKLGEALGKLDIKVNIPEEISFLNIPAGKIDIQRLFYWHVLKAFYKPDWSYEEMNHVNFDWYRPKNCHRHTPEEVRSWCETLNLEIEHINIQDSGITVISRKREL